MKNKRVIMNQKGFSLVEILVVLALVAMAGTFVMGQILDRADEGNVNGAKIQIANFRQLLEDYRRLCGQYPTSEQGLEALAQKSDKAPDCTNYPSSGFLNTKLPLDPWQMPYEYESDGSKYVITSLGKDKKAGGEKTAADIKSTDL